MDHERRAPDYGLLVATTLLVACGILFVYDSSFVRASLSGYTRYDPEFYLKRQFLWACLGVPAMLLAARFPYWKLKRVAVSGLAVATILLVAVLVFGHESNGARRSLGYGLLRFQPAEFTKLALVLFLANWLATNKRRVCDFTGGFVPLALLIGVIGGLVAIEPDLGTALVIMATGGAMLFLGGARVKHLLALLATGIVAVIGLVLMEPYRWERILSWLNPMRDPQGASYQVLNSLIALGSGGPLGRGLGQGRQKYFYLPAEHTDYIVSTIGEELGLVGTLAIVLVFAFVVGRGLAIAHRTRDPFGNLLASGLSTMIGVQTIINLGVATNLLPSTGVPLPFISYGGSSLVLTMVAMGLLMNVAQNPVVPARTRAGDRGARDREALDASTADRGWDGWARVPSARRR